MEAGLSLAASQHGSATQDGAVNEKADEATGTGSKRKVRASNPSADDSPTFERMPMQAEAVQALRPDYWDEACADLMERDRILRKLIPEHSAVYLSSRGDPFSTLARSIVGQQISVAAARSVWLKLEALCPEFIADNVLALPVEKLASCGLSRRKTEYILDLAAHFASGALHVAAWVDMDDEALIAELTQIRGIGRWTAEMFLMFNLLRPNVLPLDDAGLIKAISLNYFSGEPVTRSEAREVSANWQPWRTVATWYLWRSLMPKPADY